MHRSLKKLDFKMTYGGCSPVNFYRAAVLHCPEPRTRQHTDELFTLRDTRHQEIYHT
jgi:hypothetical protein